MKIKLFENFEETSLEIVYEIYEVDKNGDYSPIDFTDDNNDDDFNPYSLVETVKLFQKYEKKYSNLFIKKITSEILDEKIIEDVKREITAKKYNL